MIYLLSPAKTLDFDSELPTLPATKPRFLAHSSELAGIMKKMPPGELEKLMGISPKLATLNAARFRAWKPDYTRKESRQAVFVFKGGVYQGLTVEQWEKPDFAEAQKSLRILSGLYGVLRPLDMILPYRLEMGKKVATSRGETLYQFWGSLLTDSLNKDLRGKGAAVVNLASREYFTAVKKNELTAPVVTPVFKDWKNGNYKVISFFAKKARGQMAAWAIRERLTDPEDLKNFTGGGYAFDRDTSTADTWTLLRRK